MSDAIVHLLVPKSRYNERTDEAEWLIGFRCMKPPASADTFTTNRPDVTCAWCIETIEKPPADYGPTSEQPPARLY